MNKSIVEFLGTFFLVLIIGCTVLSEAVGLFAPVAIGMGLAALVYMGGHVSGAHYNPAVTIALFVRGRCPGADVGPYVVVQLAGAALAAVCAGYLVGVTPTALELPSYPQALLAEFVFTFALIFVILNVATAKGTSGNSFYGIAIGFVVMAGAFSVGAVSGGVFNPAVAVGAAMMGLLAWEDIWVHLLGSVLAALVAAGVFRVTHGPD